MNRLKPTPVKSIRGFFSEELSSALTRHGVAAEKGSFQYLVELLTQYVETENFFERTHEGKFGNNYLVDLYVKYLHAGTEERKTILKRLGDICLLVSGYFAASLNKRVSGIDYYFGMGGTAYHTLANLHLDSMVKELFKELSSKFQPFSNVLGEMGDSAGMQSNSDLIHLYERWLTTGSEALRQRLSQHGITNPTKVNAKDSH